MRLTSIVVATALVAAAPAFAATTTAAETSPATPPQETTGGQGHGVAAKIRADLSQAGFTDIHIMPQSFMVRAKNKEGMPVMMIVNPDSVTAVTEIPETTGKSTATGKSSANEGAKGTVTGSAEMQDRTKPNPVASSGGTTPAQPGAGTSGTVGSTAQ